MTSIEQVSPNAPHPARWLPVRWIIRFGWNGAILGAVALFVASSALACNLSDPGEPANDPDQNASADAGDDDADAGDDDADAGDDDADAGDDDADAGDDDADAGDDDDNVIHTEAHQWCVAADRTSDGTATAYHCTGPHDISGFKASGTHTQWKPGAFYVISESEPSP